MITNPATRILTAILAGLVLCQGLFLFLNKGIQQFNSFTNEKFHEMFLGNNNYELITAGSSRSLSNINPYILDSCLGIKTFNVGIAGANIFEIEYSLLAYMHAHQNLPKIILINIDRGTLGNIVKLYNNQIYFPYLDNPYIYSALEKAGKPAFWYKLFPMSKMFEYDDYLRNVGVQGLLGKSEITKDNFYYKGALIMSSRKVLKPNPTDPKNQGGTVTSEALKRLKNIVKKANEKGSEIIFIFGPEFHHEEGITPHNPAYDGIEKFARKNNCQILRYDNMDSVFTKDCYADTRHLNKRGADLYSKYLAKDLKKMFESQ